MTWEQRYLPPDSTLWQGQTDVPKDTCFYQHVELCNLSAQNLEDAQQNTFGLIGFKCDEGIKRDHGREGAFEGPITIRQELAKLPIQKPTIRCYDLGDVTCQDHDLEKSQQALAEIIALVLKKNIRPIVIGGSHELAFGHYQGIAAHYAFKRLGILNFDSQFDLTATNLHKSGSTKTTFYQIIKTHQAAKRHLDYNCIGIQHAGNIRQLFSIAKKLNTKLILADELHQGLQEKCFDFVDRIIDENEIIYVSLSLDVFSNAFAPGVSSIQPLGLNPWHIIPLIRQVAASGKAIGYDIAEHVPRFDIDHRTAKLAATLIYEIIHHHNEHQRM